MSGRQLVKGILEVFVCILGPARKLSSMAAVPFPTLKQVSQNCPSSPYAELVKGTGWIFDAACRFFGRN